MTRSWQPGDVAMLWVDGAEIRVMRTEKPCGGWLSADEQLGEFRADREHFKLRPLAVIDPEDRIAVGRLCDGLTGNRSMPLSDRLELFDRLTRNADQMQEALREFADPTVEPCGQQARWQGISMAEPRTFTCGLPKDHDGVTHKDEGAGADWTFSA